MQDVFILNILYIPFKFNLSAGLKINPYFPFTQLPNYRAVNACIIWGMILRWRQW